MQKKNTYKYNQLIQSEKVFLVYIKEEKTLSEICSFKTAYDMALHAELDLVQVGNRDGIPVCKIFDLDSYIYQKEKTQKKPIQNKLKTIKSSVNIDIGDLERKVEQTIKFLIKYNVVQIIITRKKLKRRFNLIEETQNKIIAAIQAKGVNVTFVKKELSILIYKK